MPTYDYRCEACGGFDALRSMGERDQPVACPGCGRPAPRVMASAPRLALLEAPLRTALATNERACHEPRRSGDYARLAHPAGCGCCSGGKRGATVHGANGNKAFPGKRPWMISH
jgi:putative FmdB family regulatory protein